MTEEFRTRKIPRNMGLGRILLGALFLFDPFVSVFDFFSDAIGYFLIAQGLSRLADMDDRLAEARRAALRLSLVGIVRLLALILAFAFVSSSEQPVFMLLVVFSLGVVDLLWVIPLWRNFGGGLSYLGSRTNATALLETRGTRSRVERYVGYTTAYFILREVLVVLPELTVLTHERGGAAFGGGFLYEAVGFFRLVGAALSLILGVVWLCKTIGFVASVRKDKPFMEALRVKYQTEVAVRQDLFAMRAVKTSMLALAAAAILSADIYVEGISLLPDPLAALAMVIAALSLRYYSEGKHRLPALVSVLYGLMASVSWGVQFKYLGFNDLTDEKLLADRLSTVKTIQTFTAILFVVAFWLILRLLYRLVRRYTGLRPLHASSTVAAERTESIHRYMRRKLVWVGAFALISAISTLVLWTVAPILPSLDPLVRPEAGEVFALMFYDFLREAYWMVDLLLGVIFAILAIHAGNEIVEQLDYSYLMN